MHALRLLHNTLKKSCPEMHVTRLNSMVSAVQSLLEGNRLTLSALGRSSVGPSHVKNKIKRIDRLIGNPHLHNEIIDCYKALAHLLIGTKKHPIIIVDWSTVDLRNKFHVLKATLVYRGRSITIYDHVEFKDRQRSKFNNSHDRFIENLSKILPENCKPIIVSDAAFIARWFKRIEAREWYWVGRLRGLVKMRIPNQKSWKTCKMMFKKASKIPQALGEFVLSKKNPLNARIYIYQGPKKGRKRKNRDGSIRKNNHKEDHQRAANEPWLLASNLPKKFNIEKKVVAIYKTRMQIEETFRDIKDYRYGLGVQATLSNSKERITVLLLIGALGLLVFGVLGRAGYESGAYKHFQANTIKDRRVLSFWYLGQQIYEHYGALRAGELIRKTWKTLLKEIPTYESI